MLYVNGEILDLNNASETYPLKAEVQEYKVKIQALKDQYGKVVQIISTRKPQIDPVTKRLIPMPTVGIEMQSHMVDKGQRKEWIYSESSLNRVHGKLKIDVPIMLIKVNGELYLNIEEQSELVYYIIYKSNQCTLDDTGRADFRVYNRRKEIKKTAEDRKRVAKLGALIYDEMKDTDVRVLAKRYGVGNVNTLTPDEVRNALYDKVWNNEQAILRNDAVSSNGIDAFFRDSNLDLKTQVGALIQDALDKGILLFNERERRYDIDYNDGRTPYPLMEVSVADLRKHRESLLDFLFLDGVSLDRLKAAMGFEDNVLDDVFMDIVTAEGRPMVLRKLAREKLGWEAPKTMTSAELKIEIEKRFKELQTV